MLGPELGYGFGGERRLDTELGWPRIVPGHFVRFGQRFGAQAPLRRAPPVDETAPRDHRNEGRLRGDRGIVAIRAFPEIEEDLLHGIFGIRSARRVSTGERPHQIAEVSETLAHGRAIPLRDAAKQKGTHGYSRFSRLPITGVDFAAIWAKPTVERLAARAIHSPAQDAWMQGGSKKTDHHIQAVRLLRRCLASARCTGIQPLDLFRHEL